MPFAKETLADVRPNSEQVYTVSKTLKLFLAKKFSRRRQNSLQILRQELAAGPAVPGVSCAGSRLRRSPLVWEIIEKLLSSEDSFTTVELFNIESKCLLDDDY